MQLPGRDRPASYNYSQCRPYPSQIAPTSNDLNYPSLTWDCFWFVFEIANQPNPTL